jgi:hypothetical protein
VFPLKKNLGRSQKTTEKLFPQSLTYIEGVHNKLFGRRFGGDDFEQLNAFYSSSGLEKNIDLLQLFEKVEKLTMHVTQEIVDKVEREASKLVDDYLVHRTSVFLLDGSAYSSLSESLKHALTVYHVVQEKRIDNKLFKAYPKLERILSRKKISDSIIDGWYFNNHFFTIDHSIFEYLEVHFEIVKTTDKAFCVRAINFLEQVNSYKKGERISKISSNWVPTRSGKDRWKGSWLDTIVEGDKDKTAHGFDWISDNELIYQNTYGIALSGGSETNLYERAGIDNDWQKVKCLQKLIR